MPQSLDLAIFIFGAVLILLALVSGGFKLFGAEVSGTAGKLGRVTAFVLGVAMLCVALGRATSSDEHKAAPGGPHVEPAAPAESTPASPKQASPTKKASATTPGRPPADDETDASADAPPTPRPKRTQPPRVDMTGTWMDSAGGLVDVVQEGDQIRLSSTNRFGVFIQGQGVIRGNRVMVEYRTSLPSFGRSAGTLSPDGRRLAATCQESTGERSPCSLIRQ